MAIFNTNGGKGIITAALAAYANVPKYVGWGTGSGQTASSTGLATEAAETSTTKATGTASVVTTTVTNDTLRVIATIVAAATRAITEAATFTAASAGTMFTYGDFSVINLATSDSIEFTIDTKFV